MHNKGQHLYSVTLTPVDPADEFLIHSSKYSFDRSPSVIGTQYSEIFAPNRDAAVQAAKDFWGFFRFP